MLEFTIQAVLTDGSANQRAGRRADNNEIEAKWRAQLENELQRARMFGILNQISEDDYNEFPYNNLSFFERNEKICWS